MHEKLTLSATAWTFRRRQPAHNPCAPAPGLRPVYLAGLSRLVPAVGDIQCRHNDEQNKDEGKRDHDIAPLEKPKRWLSVEPERMKRPAERPAPNSSSRRRAL